jgi:hypothetical protein
MQLLIPFVRVFESDTQNSIPSNGTNVNVVDRAGAPYEPTIDFWHATD